MTFTDAQVAKTALLASNGTVVGAELPRPGRVLPGWRGLRAQAGDMLVWIDDTDHRRNLYVIDRDGWHAPLTAWDLPAAVAA